MGKNLKTVTIGLLMMFLLNGIILEGSEIQNRELKNIVVLDINEQKILLDPFSTNKIYDIDELNSEVPIEFKIEHIPDEIEVRVMGNILKDRTKIKIEKISRDIKIPIEILDKNNNYKTIE